jgi:cyclohexyl-isocyanide hydratase
MGDWRHDARIRQAPGGRCALRHLGLHRRSGAWRRRTAQGKRATTHWASHHLLESLGAVPVHARVVRDGNLMTGGGVTAGIDFALTLIAELAGQEVAKAIELNLESAPAPPFGAGRPETAPAAAAQTVRKRIAPIVEERRKLAEAAAKRLGLGSRGDAARL